MKRRIPGSPEARGPQQDMEPTKLSIDEGFALVDTHRSPFPPEDLSDTEKTAYHMAFDAITRAFNLKEILGDDVSTAAAAEKFRELAEQFASTNDGAWGEKSGAIAEQIRTLVSPYLDTSTRGIGNVLQAARDMHTRPEVFEANVELIKNGTLDPNVQAAINRQSKK